MRSLLIFVTFNNHQGQLWGVLMWKSKFLSGLWEQAAKRNDRRRNKCMQICWDMSAAPFICLFIIRLTFSWHRKDSENTPDSRECAWEELRSARVCAVFVCVFSHPVMPTSPLPPSSGQARPICHIPPSIPSSIPPPSAACCPSLLLRTHPPFPSLLFLYLPPATFSVILHLPSNSPSYVLHHLFLQQEVFFFCSPSPLWFISPLSLLSLSSPLRPYTSKLKLITTCGCSSLCNNNSIHHQKITSTSLWAVFHCSPSYLRPTWDPAGSCRALRPSVTAPCWTTLIESGPERQGSCLGNWHCL